MRGGVVRRDAEPHRGDTLEMLANLAFILVVLSFPLCLPLVVAMPFGLVVRVMAGRDLDRMASGVMVREGSTKRGKPG
jgi:hypothetical protein